jgi:hypothetical protein
MKHVFAEETITLPPINPTGYLPWENPTLAVSNIVSAVISMFLIVGGFVVFFQFLLAGFAFISSEGDPQKLAKARNKIIWAFIGLVILASAFGLIMLAQSMLGVCFGFGCELNPSELYPG